MPRRPIEVGEHGEVKLLAWVQDSGAPAIRSSTSRSRATHWTAEARVRVSEGSAGLIRVRARGTSRADARSALDRGVAQILAHPAEYRADAAVKLTPRMALRVYAEQVWIPAQRAKVAAGDRAVGSRIRYEQVLKAKILPVFGRVPISRLSTGDIARMLAMQTPAIAKTCRSVLRSILDAALVDGVASSNPAAQLPRISRPRGSIHRASGLSSDQVVQFLKVLRSDIQACDAELPDVLAFIAGTGVRTGEALALAWQDVDLAAGRVVVTATVNAEGKRQVRPKTSAGYRELSVPVFVLDVLRQRSFRRNPTETAEHPALVFPSDRLGRGARREMDTPRWVGNFTGQVRTSVDRLITEAALDAEFAGVSARWLRKAAALALDAAGISPRQLADQLGHARPSVSLDVYTPRMGHGPSEAADILNLESRATTATPAVASTSGKPRDPRS